MSNDSRVTPGVPAGGQFAAQNRPEGETLTPDTVTSGPDEFADLLPGESFIFSHANGDFDASATVFESIEVYRSEDDAEPAERLWAEASVYADFHHLSNDDAYLSSHANEIDSWLRENYSDLRIDGAPEDADWEDTVLVSDIDFSDEEFPKTFGEVVAGGTTRTGFAMLDLSPKSKFWTSLKDHLDDGDKTISR